MREVRCIGCGQINRIPRYSIYRIPRCAKCDLKLHEPPLITRARSVYIHRGRWLLVVGVAAGSAAAITLGNIGTLTPPAPLSTPSTGVTKTAITPPADLVKPVSPSPTAFCAYSWANGAVLDQKLSVQGPHHLEIENGMSGNAIIKVRDAATGRLVVEFYVLAGKTASFNQLPDGTYRIQYAIGHDLAEDCESFTRTDDAKEFPGTDTLLTIYTPDGVIHYRPLTLTYSLYPVPFGKVRPNTISLEQFNAP